MNGLKTKAMASARKITVIGGTGNLGAPVVKFLMNFGFEVKIIVRDTEKAIRIFGKAPSITMVNADLTDVPALTRALSGTEYLYLNLGTNTMDVNSTFCPDREGVANILKAIDKQNIKQILMISGLGAFTKSQISGHDQFIPNVIRMQGHERIRKSGIPFTLLHCSWFADSFVFFRRNHVYSVIGDARKPIYFTNCYDFASHLANATGNQDAYNREFPIQGTEGISHLQAAKTFLNEFDQTAKVRVLPHGLISILALFNKEMKFVQHMSSYFSKYVEIPLAEANGTYAILGKPGFSLVDYAKKLKAEGIFNYLG